jgi:hypothetical protein
MVPIADREDGRDLRMMTRQELAASEPRESFLADLIEACRV